MSSWGITSCSHREALGTESTPLFFSVLGVDFTMNTVWRPRRDLNPCYRREGTRATPNCTVQWGLQQLERTITAAMALLVEHSVGRIDGAWA